MVHYDLTPIPSTTIKDLDLRKIQEYFLRFNDFDILREDEEVLERLLLNANILVESEQKVEVTLGGMLIFGKLPELYLPYVSVHFDNLEERR